MSQNKPHRKPLAALVGSAFVASLAAGSLGAAQFDANPFAMTELPGGYKVAQEGQCGAAKAKPEQEGQCGANKAKQVQEGQCGANETKQTQEGQCGAAKAKKTDAEGKCGEAKCGASK